VSERVTGAMMMRNALANLDRARVRLAVTQEQAASQLRINRPSDDPGGASRAAALRAALAETARLRANVDQGRARLSAVEAALGQARDVLARARELAIQGANGTQDATTRAAIAAEIAVLFDELVAAGNADHDGSAVFAGTASDAPAFSTAGSFAGGSPPLVTFDGSADEIEISIGGGQRVATTLDGRRVFRGDADGDGAPDPGREDLFALLGDLWQALVDDDPAAVAGTLGRLERAQRQLELAVSEVGARGARLETAAERLAGTDVDLRTRLSNVQDADTLRVLSDLVSQETALRAALEATARALPPTLVDFLS